MTLARKPNKQDEQTGHSPVGNIIHHKNQIAYIKIVRYFVK